MDYIHSHEIEVHHVHFCFCLTCSPCIGAKNAYQNIQIQTKQTITLPDMWSEHNTIFVFSQHNMMIWHSMRNTRVKTNQILCYGIGVIASVHWLGVFCHSCENPLLKRL